MGEGEARSPLNLLAAELRDKFSLRLEPEVDRFSFLGEHLTAGLVPASGKLSLWRGVSWPGEACGEATSCSSPPSGPGEKGFLGLRRTVSPPPRSRATLELGEQFSLLAEVSVRGSLAFFDSASVDRSSWWEERRLIPRGTWEVGG